MGSRGWLNLLLGLGVLGLALLAWQRPGLEPPAAEHLTRLDAGQVRQILIEHDEVRLRFEKQAQGWVLLGPPDIPADPLQIGSLLGLLSVVPERSYPANAVQLDQAGLDPPKSRLHFDGLEIAFGATEPLGRLRYVRIGERVALVEDRYGPMVSGRRAQFASRRLLPEGSRIRRLQLPDRSLRRGEDSHWQVEPEPTGLSADAVARLIDRWQQARAIWVSASKEAADGKAIEIELEGMAEPLRFQLVTQDGRQLLLRPELGLAYHLGPAVLQSLLQLQAEGAQSSGDSSTGTSSDVSN
ncbi:DUF4340 domain-containing protein [Thiohalobacter sp. IOR34]|uniref:DUF4340 domain-containing protein n=1 Tax=Thiohalobacter sp. IOR34 TaxID=3057176 RepID=UPI0025B23571|nr:DUF4340 domain-containing protein [Thiohalobacter sp. IOR34]WJW75755.1 DUF4340 domain-containing protein [Thiohalobacter sp. IOR34]